MAALAWLKSDYFAIRHWVPPAVARGVSDAFPQALSAYRAQTFRHLSAIHLRGCWWSSLFNSCNDCSSAENRTTAGIVFDLPLTQEGFGDALGLTAVHLNPVVRKLCMAGVMELTAVSLIIIDAKLATAAGFDDGYLDRRPPADSDGGRGPAECALTICPTIDQDQHKSVLTYLRLKRRGDSDPADDRSMLVFGSRIFR